MEFAEKYFKLKESKTTVKTEVYAGITTFMTMAYILAVNPNILSATGMDAGALVTATALSSAFATLLMAFLANYPLALAPGMGLNAFFAFTVVLGMGYSWQMALTAVFVEGIVFILLSLFSVREAIFNAIPMTLKSAVSVGIGLFIAFIGFQNAGIIVGNPDTLVTLGNVKDITVFLALMGTVVTIVLSVRKVKGALLWGILLTYVLGILCQLAGLYEVNPEIGRYSLIPSGSILGIMSLPPSLAPIAFQFDFSNLFSLDFLVIMFTFLFVDLFDTLGTLIGVGAKANLLDKDGKLPRAKGALLSDAIGTLVGACMGTSTVTTYVESAAGVAEGGRTGLSALVTSLLFALSIMFAPLFTAIPGFATAPALIVVGLFMLDSIVKIDFNDFTEGFPAFLTIILMPLCYSISEGLVFGVISYTIVKIFSGKSKEVSPVILVIAFLFVLKLFLG